MKVITITCVFWIWSMVTIIPYAIKVDYDYSMNTCERFLAWDLFLVTLVYFPSFPFILYWNCVAVKYLQR